MIICMFLMSYPIKNIYENEISRKNPVCHKIYVKSITEYRVHHMAAVFVAQTSFKPQSKPNQSEPSLHPHIPTQPLPGNM